MQQGCGHRVKVPDAFESGLTGFSTGTQVRYFVQRKQPVVSLGAVRPRRPRPMSLSMSRPLNASQSLRMISPGFVRERGKFGGNSEAFIPDRVKQEVTARHRSNTSRGLM